MTNNELLDNWKSEFFDDKKTQKKLSKMNDLIDSDPFFIKLFFDSKKIISRIGIGYGLLNKLTIRLIASSFAEVLIKNKKNESQLDILIATDGSEETKAFLENISEVFEAKGLINTAFKGYCGYDRKFVCRTVKKLELDGSILIEKSIYNNEIFNIFFINSQGIDFEKSILQEIQQEINQQDIFNIPTKPAKIQFLSNNKLISNYVSKLLSLHNRKGDQKKVKVAISNYNEGTTKILKKILGTMDFNYVINNNLNAKNINKNKKRNSKIFLKFYRRDISFSRKNRCDILICPSINGTQLNLFVFNNRQAFYLDANEITLMFLNFFLVEINIGHKKILNFYIGADIPPIKSVKNLINKYNLELSISENIKIIDNKYLLFYWNQESQFIFGENKIIDFGFHHLIVKFLEMMNYYKTQRLNIHSQRNVLIKMYGSYKTHILIFNFDLYKIYDWLKNIKNSYTHKKIPIESVILFDDLNILNENLIAKIILKNGIELFVKFNYLNKKIVIFISLKNEKISILNLNKNSFISQINSLIKKDLKYFIH